jgi:hypothetical protein
MADHRPAGDLGLRHERQRAQGAEDRDVQPLPVLLHRLFLRLFGVRVTVLGTPPAAGEAALVLAPRPTDRLSRCGPTRIRKAKA